MVDSLGMNFFTSLGLVVVGEFKAGLVGMLVFDKAGESRFGSCSSLIAGVVGLQ